MIKTLKQLERNLGYKVRDNIFCLAVDTATKSGIAILFINKGKLQIHTCLMELPKLSKDSETKAEKYEEHLREFVKLVDEVIIKPLPTYNKQQSLLVLENSFMALNVVTFGFLRALQGILYAKLCNKFETVRILFPTTARNMVGFVSHLPKGTKSKDKKKEIIKWISNVIEEPVKDDNCADALLLCFAGIKI
jgi:hypothetical protein